MFLANVYAEAKQFDKAAEELRAGLKNDPKDLSCLLGLTALALRRDNAQSLQEAGEQLEEIMLRFKDEKSRRYGRSYLLLRGIHSALTDHPTRAKAAFQQVLQMKKGEPTATRALVALGGPLGPDDQQLAIDYIEEQRGYVGRKEGQADSPVTRIDLPRDNITDDDLFVLTALPQLRELNLSSSEITDSGLARLKGLQNLRRLHLGGTKITDAGLVHLRGLKQLQFVNVRSTKVTREGIAELRKTLPKLEINR